MASRHHQTKDRRSRVLGMNYDGPSDAGGSRAGSSRARSSAKGESSARNSPQPTGSDKAGSQSGGSRTGSRAGSTSKESPKEGGSWPQPLGYDPAKDPSKPQEGMNTRLELPPEAYSLGKTTDFAIRPGFNTSGRPINVDVNQFRISKVAFDTVYQFAVSVSPENKGTVFKKVWGSKTVQDKLATLGGSWLYDGRALAWSNIKVPGDIRCSVDLDTDPFCKNMQRSSGRNNFYMIIRPTGRILMESLKMYLTGDMDFDDHVLECMNFLDHALRQTPQQSMRMFKRTFFPKEAQHQDLDSTVEAIKGIFCSIRMNQSVAQGGLGLGINVDVSNCAFYLPQAFEQLAREFIRAHQKNKSEMTYQQLASLLKPVMTEIKDGEGRPTGKSVLTPSESFRMLRKLAKIRFTVRHTGKADDKKEYIVKQFTWDAAFGTEGAHAKNVKFDKKLPNGTVQSVSIYDHFEEKYGRELRYWYLPCIETTRDGIFAMEVCTVMRYNRYPFKLDSQQTSQMIRFAVTRPPQRRSDIMTGVAKLNWANDPILRDFGIKVEPTFSRVQARHIKNPEIQFANKKLNPGDSGRWDLRGCKFMQPNKVPLRSWGVAVVESCVDKPTVDRFVQVFQQAYSGHGGRIEKAPLILNFPRNTQHDIIVQDMHNKVGAANKFSPQIVFFIVPEKIGWVYERMKKNADCRWAMLTQMVLMSHVRKAQPQYCSNVAMKVNAKLGGQTSRIPSAGSGSAFFPVPTMMIGADVSHNTGNPNSSGGVAPSMAAMTVSMDKDAAFYCADAQTNGYRVEIIQRQHINQILPPLVKLWVKNNSLSPAHLFYLRDGVSEGQFSDVLQTEMAEIKQTFTDLGIPVPKVTVIVATKRHHIRFFPEQGDKNKNPLPGTLVEREVTHPFHYDFYLCSHVAIQGTARPVHYHVIHDEINMKPDDLQRMLYHQCYQYARSTTPVSLHPAVYYAHLASYRARSHENAATSDQVPRGVKHKVMPKVGALAKQDPSMASSAKQYGESIPLLQMGGPNSREDMRIVFRQSMWYI